MAQVTDQLVTTETAVLTVTYDDVTLDLVSANAVVTAPTLVRIYRKNGTTFRDVVVQPGEFVVNFPAGPVRKLDDLNFFSVVS